MLKVKPAKKWSLCVAIDHSTLQTKTGLTVVLEGNQTAIMRVVETSSENPDVKVGCLVYFPPELLKPITIDPTLRHSFVHDESIMGVTPPEDYDAREYSAGKPKLTVARNLNGHN